MSDDENSAGKGRAKGGLARAAALTPDKRREIARKAAVARWGAKATHKGSFNNEFGIDVDCYVLDDDKKTAVISQRGMGEALGFSEGGSRLPRFVNSKTIAPYVGPDLREKLENPVVFQGLSAGPTTLVHGYDVTILIDLCKAILRAESDGALHPSQAHIAKQAQTIVSGSAKAGIQQLVYALAGYDATREEIIAAFKMYVRQEARDYEKEFPNQLYEQWYRIYQLPKPERNKPWKFKHLTVDQVYKPLAKSSGKILELAKLQRESGAQRHKKLHQFLSDIGVKALRQHLGQLLGIAQISKDRSEYEKHVRTVFGDQRELDV